MKHFLFHLGPLPKHLNTCIDSILRYPNNNIALCTDQNVTYNSNRVTIINVNKLNSPHVKKYFHLDPNPLWITSLLRIHYLNEYYQNYCSDEPLLHFDNDVLYYNDPQILRDKIKEEVYITPHKQTEYTFGFSIINNKEKMANITKRVFDIVQKGERFARSITGDNIHEMRLLGYIDDGIITKLPVLPEELNEFDFIFDPSSYGQYIGGTPNGHSPGFIDRKQYVGSKLTDNMQIIFDDKPYIIANNKKYNIFNLHIHCKKLNKFYYE